MTNLPARDGAGTPARRGPAARSRTLLVGVLVALAAILTTITAPAVWGRNLVLDNDRFVRTLAPLASDPGVQDAVIDAVNAQFADRIDIASLAKEALPPAAAPLAAPLQAAAESLVSTIITRFVRGDAFQALWEDITRVAHAQVVAVLTGRDSNDSAVSIQNDEVVLSLAPVMDRVKQELVDAGLGFAANVPSSDATITVAQVSGVDAARGYVRLLNRLAHWLPVLAALCLVGALVAARDRRATLIAAMLSIAAGMLALGLGLAIGRAAYLDQLPGTYLSAETSGSIYDALVRYLRLGLRVILIGALLVALVAWLSGRGAVPRRARSAWTRLRRSAAAGSTIAAARSHQLAVYGGIAGMGAIVLVLWTNPSSAVVICVAVIVLVVIGLAALLLGPRPTRADPHHPEAQP